MLKIALLLICGIAAHAYQPKPPKGFDNDDFVWAVANANAFRYSALYGEPNSYPQLVFQEYDLKPDGKYFNKYETVDGVKVKVEGTFVKKGYQYVPKFTGTVEYKNFEGKYESQKFYVNEYGYKFENLEDTVPFTALKALNVVMAPAPYAAKVSFAKVPNVISQKLVSNYDGSYSNYFETENGFKVQETRSYKLQDGFKVLSVKGQMWYVDEDGKEQSFKYYGDNSGYKFYDSFSVEKMPKSVFYAWEYFTNQKSYLVPFTFYYYPRVVYQSREFKKDGTFVNELLTDGGVKVYEKGSYKVFDGVKYPVYSGKFTYVDKSSGKTYGADYFVNEKGFKLGDVDENFVIPFEVFKAVPLSVAGSSYYPVPVSREAEHPKIVSQILKVNTDGTYTNAFSTENGIQLSETGSVKYGPDGKPIPVVNGMVGYQGEGGKHYSITYSADENGYRPVMSVN